MSINEDDYHERYFRDVYRYPTMIKKKKKKIARIYMWQRLKHGP